MQSPSGIRFAIMSAGVLLIAALFATTIVISRSTASRITTLDQTDSVSSASVRCFSNHAAFVQFFQDQFGLMPEAVHPISQFPSAESFLDHHCDQSQTATQELSLQEFVDSALQRERSGVILGPHEAAAVITNATVDDRGRPCLQILESQRALRLETVERLLAAGFTRVRTARSAPPEISFAFGRAQAGIDHLLIPLGLINPATDVPATFRVCNTGSRPVLIGRIEPSCSCTSIEPADEVLLNPGDSQIFDLQLSSGDSGSSVHHVDLQLFEKGAGISRNVRVTVCGNVLSSFRVSPPSLNLGAVDGFGSAPATRTIRITESDSDPFEITSVEATGAPLDLKWDARQTDDGRQKEYILTVHCDGREMSSPAFEGEIIVHTTSARRPRAVIPFEGTIQGAFEAVPEVGAFGMIPMHQSVTEKILISSRIGAIDDASLTACPPWVSCEMATREDVVALTLTAQTDTPGYHFGKLRLKLESSLYSDEIAVPCSLFVHQKKGLND